MIIFPLFPCHLCHTRESLRQQIQNKHTQYVTYMCLQQGLTHLDLQAQNTPSLHCTSTGWDKASITGHHKRETETGLGSGLNRRKLGRWTSSTDTLSPPYSQNESGVVLQEQSWVSVLVVWFFFSTCSEQSWRLEPLQGGHQRPSVECLEELLAQKIKASFLQEDRPPTGTDWFFRPSAGRQQSI